MYNNFYFLQYKGYINCKIDFKADFTFKATWFVIKGQNACINAISLSIQKLYQVNSIEL